MYERVSILFSYIQLIKEEQYKNYSFSLHLTEKVK